MLSHGITESTRRIAVTGATGFIGRRLVRHLAAEGHQMRILVRRPAPELEAPGVVSVPGSLEDAGSLRHLVADADAVVHAAGLTLTARPADFHRINAAAAGRLAGICAGLSPPPRFVMLSSLAAREPALSDYAASKRRGEEAVASFAGLPSTLIRPPAVYGPNDSATLEIFRMMARGLLPVPPDPAARASLIHVDDLCAGIGALLNIATAPGTVMEIRDGRPDGYGWREIAATAGRCLGRHVRCIPMPRSLLWLAGHIGVLKSQLTGKAARISPGKVRELCHIDWVCRDNPLAHLTGWSPRIGIDEGFLHTLGWYRERGWL